MGVSTSDTDQLTADPNRRLVTITVDGYEYRVRAGTHSLASLASGAVLVGPPSPLGVKVALYSRENEKYLGSDAIEIKGGEAFVTLSPMAFPAQDGQDNEF
jgi:hypothetical protein